MGNANGFSRHLHSLRQEFPGVPILALTATATGEVITDICSSLHLEKPNVVVTSFDRPNLVSSSIRQLIHTFFLGFCLLQYLEVSSKLAIWEDLKPLLEPTVDDPYAGSTIIYCPTRKDVEKVADVLVSHGIKVD